MTDRKPDQGPLASERSNKPELTTHNWLREQVPSFETPEVCRRVGELIAGHAHRRRKFPNDPDAK
jgi:hypothetical protein